MPLLKVTVPRNVLPRFFLMILPSGILVIGKSICVYGYGFVEIKLRGVMDTAESDSAVLVQS